MRAPEDQHQSDSGTNPASPLINCERSMRVPLHTRAAPAASLQNKRTFLTQELILADSLITTNQR
jgi:hypothetical protein